MSDTGGVKHTLADPTSNQAGRGLLSLLSPRLYLYKATLINTSLPLVYHASWYRMRVQGGPPSGDPFDAWENCLFTFPFDRTWHSTHVKRYLETRSGFRLISSFKLADAKALKSMEYNKHSASWKWSIPVLRVMFLPTTSVLTSVYQLLDASGVSVEDSPSHVRLKLKQCQLSQYLTQTFISSTILVSLVD